MDNFNKDEMKPHSWMNLEFFEEVMKTIENANFSKILDFQISPATAKGDHYASVMFRVVIKYLIHDNTEKEISVIMKTLPEEDGIKKDLFKGSKIFETEIRMFREIIPKFEEMLKSKGDETTLAAKMLYSSLSPRIVIVLEDITKKGFATIGKRVARIDEIKMAMNKLAKWHACSYIMNADNKGSLETFQDGLFNMPGIDENDVFTSGMTTLIKVANVIPQLKQYVPKLEKIKDKLFEKCKKMNEFCKSDAKLNVLIHGDFHSKNLMFQFSQNGLAEEVMLLDFQICAWGSMAIDLIYSKYLMTDSQNRIAHTSELTNQFFQTFINTLKQLKFKGELPQFSDLQQDLLNLGHFDLFLACTFLPLIHEVNNNPNPDLDDLMSSNEDYRLGLYKSPTYVADIEILLKEFSQKGFLDGYDDNYEE